MGSGRWASAFGVMAARADQLWGWLAQVGNDNAAGEYYLRTWYDCGRDGKFRQ